MSRGCDVVMTSFVMYSVRVGEEKLREEYQRLVERETHTLTALNLQSVSVSTTRSSTDQNESRDRCPDGQPRYVAPPSTPSLHLPTV